MRDKLMMVMKEADQDGSGSLDFPDFLRLMRAVNDLNHKHQLKKERRAIKATGFGSHKVYGFRELFLNHADAEGLLSQKAFQGMIAPILPLGDRNVTALTILWSDDSGDGDGRDTSDSSDGDGWDTEHNHQEMLEKDFPDFLFLIKRVLTTNFGGVIERTKWAAPDGGTD